MKYFPKYFFYFSFLIASICIVLSGCRKSGLIIPPSHSLGSSLNSNAAERFPQFSHDGRFLVFTSDRRGERMIALYDFQKQRLISLPGVNQPGNLQDQPDVSADGRFLVYVSEHQGKPDIFLYDRQTVQLQNLTQDLGGEVRHPSISGNGRFVAFETNRSGQWDIVVYDRGLK